MIYLTPIGGLCNRMYAVTAAIALARDLETELNIYWVPMANMNCPFYQIFEPIFSFRRHSL